MKEVHTEIEIEASAERVWQLLTDFASFQQWDPFIRRASGEVKTGGRLEVYLQPSGVRGGTLRPIVLMIEPNRELRWRGRLWIPGLFDGEHIFTIEHLGQTGCGLFSGRYSPDCSSPCLRVNWTPTRGGALKK